MRTCIHYYHHYLKEISRLMSVYSIAIPPFKKTIHFTFSFSLKIIRKYG